MLLTQMNSKHCKRNVPFLPSHTLSKDDWPQVHQWGGVKKEVMGSALKTHLSAHFRVPQCETVAPG